MSEIRSTRANETVSRIEMGERAVQDLLIVLSMLFTGLIAINVAYLLMVGDSVADNPITNISKTTAEYVIPWAGALALLLIARELWLIRIYMEGIHIGFELESMLTELKRIEAIEKREEAELEKIEKIEKHKEELLEREEKELEKIEAIERKLLDREEAKEKKRSRNK